MCKTNSLSLMLGRVRWHSPCSMHGAMTNARNHRTLRFPQVPMPLETSAITLLLVLAGACGGDEEPISVSSPVGISLPAEAGDVDNGVITVDKNINTESGNPWGAFITDVDSQLGGPPSDMDIESLTLLLATSAEGFSELREVFDGTVDVQFEMNNTGTFVSVGSVDIDTTTEGREIELTEDFNFADLQGDDLDTLMSGSFKVVMSGPAASGFEVADGKAETQLTMTFAAFE